MTDEQTIQRGYPPVAHRRLCVDFDKTLYPFGRLMEEPEPLRGAVEGMRRLRDRGYRLIIWTARLDPDWLAEAKYSESEQREYIERLLVRDGIPFDAIHAKPAAEAYIDDRAIRFEEGEWPSIVDWIIWSDEPKRNDCE